MIKGTLILLSLSLTLSITLKRQTKEFQFKNRQKEMDIYVKKNDQFFISLEGNPTTGYTWTVTNVNDFASAITPINLDSYNSTDTISISSNPLLMGAPSTYRFLFGVVRGKTKRPLDIKFVYKRAWETNSGESKTVHVNIK